MRERFLSLADAAWRAPKTFFAVMAGLAVLAASTVVFLGASEDVIGRNGAANLDATRLSWFTDHRSTPLIAVARFFDTAASVAVVAVLAIGVGIWLWRRGLPAIVAAAPLAAVAASELVAGVLKVTVDRPRPAGSLRLVAETDPSFPSGHATAAMAFGVSVAVIVVLFVLRRGWSRVVTLTVGVLLPTVIGASRLELGVHWPTDVVAGLALGACAALAVSGLAVWFAARQPGESSPAGGRVSVLRSHIMSIMRRRRVSEPLLVTA